MDMMQGAARRARAYWWSDGISDVVMGVVFFLYGFFCIVRGPNAVAQGRITWLLIWVGFWVVLDVARISAPFIRKAKEAVTYPRTGYAGAPPAAPFGRRFWLYLSPVPLLLILADVTLNPTDIWQPYQAHMIDYLFRLLPILNSLLVLALFVYRAVRTGESRYYTLSAFALLLTAGLVVVARDVPWSVRITPIEEGGLLQQIGAYCLCMGGALLMSGLLTFRRYVQAYPAPYDEEEV